jgi:hypothetical protein
VPGFNALITFLLTLIRLYSRVSFVTGYCHSTWHLNWPTGLFFGMGLASDLIFHFFLYFLFVSLRLARCFGYLLPQEFKAADGQCPPHARECFLGWNKHFQLSH